MARGLLYVADELGDLYPCVGTLDSIPDIDVASLQDGYTLIWDATNQKWIVGAGAASPVNIQDEGVGQGSSATLNFTGLGVSATIAGGVTTIDIPGSAPGALDLNDLGDVVVPSPADKEVLIYSSGSGTWINAGIQRSITFSYSGTLVVGTNGLRFYNTLDKALTIEKVHLSANTAPTGTSILVDLHKNGTTIFTNQANRPAVAAGANTGQTTTIDLPSFGIGDYLQVYIDQIGSTGAGSDLMIQIVVR